MRYLNSKPKKNKDKDYKNMSPSNSPKINNPADENYNPMKAEEMKDLQEFIKENSLRYYETSTKLHFNFNRFFLSIFNEKIKASNDIFSSSYVEEKLNNILLLKPNFSKAERKTQDIKEEIYSEDYEELMLSTHDSKIFI